MKSITKLVIALALLTLPARAQVGGVEWQNAGVRVCNTVRANNTSGTPITCLNGVATLPFGGGGGVTSAIAGTGISVSAATGAVTLTNTGVRSLTVSGLPLSITAGSTPTLSIVPAPSVTGAVIYDTGTTWGETAGGSSTTVLHGNAAGAPTWSAVNLTTDVTGTLPATAGGTGVTSTIGSGHVLRATGAVFRLCHPLCSPPASRRSGC